MRNTPNMKAEAARIAGPKDSNYGAFGFVRRGVVIHAIASEGAGWDHVSVSVHDPHAKRCPTWEEMCFVKDIFFRDDETVVQYHPAKEDYINCHPGCLHMWRPQTQEEFAKAQIEIEQEAAVPGNPPLPDFYPKAAPPPLPKPPKWAVGPE